MHDGINGDQMADLPENVRHVLQDFIGIVIDFTGKGLRSAILYGSAAEGRLRAVSDVNLLLIVDSFDIRRLDGIRDKLRFASAAIRLRVMFLTESEIQPTSAAFAVKYTDILHRHRVLYGQDFFHALKIPRVALLQRLEQDILNLKLRLRERYLMLSLREEKLCPVIADMAAPIRSCAATLLELEGDPRRSPKESLAVLAERLQGSDWTSAFAAMSAVRENRILDSGVAIRAVNSLLGLLEAMYQQIQRLR